MSKKDSAGFGARDQHNGEWWVSVFDAADGKAMTAQFLTPPPKREDCPVAPTGDGTYRVKLPEGIEWLLTPTLSRPAKDK
jgi:hypothetical protein